MMHKLQQKKCSALIKFVLDTSLALSLFMWISAKADAQTTINDESIKKLIIAESIAQYPGTCACPYNLTRNGRQCGKKSAWSKGGGYNPICYSGEITADMIENYRKLLQP